MRGVEQIPWLSGMRGPAATGPIGRTAQLARAIELGIGAPPERVEVVGARRRLNLCPGHREPETTTRAA